MDPLPCVKHATMTDRPYGSALFGSTGREAYPPIGLWTHDPALVQDARPRHRDLPPGTSPRE